MSKAMTLNVRVAAERFELLKAELTKAFAAPEADYQSLNVGAVLARNAPAQSVRTKVLSLKWDK